VGLGPRLFGWLHPDGDYSPCSSIFRALFAVSSSSSAKTRSHADRASAACPHSRQAVPILYSS
jgi:hypothetical protein